MKSTFKFLAAASMMTMAGSMLFVGCGPSTGGDCTLNSDCTAGEICDTDTNECIPQGDACTASADCTGENEYCIASQDNSGEFVCGATDSCGQVVEADRDAFCNDGAAGERCLTTDGALACRAPANCGEATDVNTFCRNSENGGAEDTYTCEADACVKDADPAEFQLVLIDDTTTVDCNPVPRNGSGGYDPGSDIMWVRLDDAAAQVKGWGRTVTLNLVASMPANTYTNGGVLSGTAPDLATGDREGCPARVMDLPALRAETAVALGCTGNVIVDFPRDSERQSIYNGDVVTVGEYASICNNVPTMNANGTDTYDVYVCPALAAGAAAPSDVDCRTNGTKINTSNLGGIRSQTVSGAKDAPAQ